MAAASFEVMFIMNRIVSIEWNPNESRYWLELDDGQRLGVSPTVYLESGYSLDDQIGQDDWHHLARKEEKAQLRKRALTILDYGDRTEAELRKRLQGDLELIEELIRDLRAAGLVDDQRYVEHSVERHLRRGGWGSRKLRYQLQRLGVTQELVDAAVATIDEESERSAALAWAGRQLRGQDQGDPSVMRRVYGSLIRHGFGHSTAHSVIRSLGSHAQEDHEEP